MKYKTKRAPQFSVWDQRAWKKHLEESRKKAEERRKK